MSSSRDARAARRAQRSQQQNADAVFIQAQPPPPREPVRRQRESRPHRVTDPSAVPDISAVADEHVDDDHLCPICQLLLHEPVRTTCNHTLCRFCMATWASVSLAAPMVVVDVDEIPIAFDPVSELEARCPMCRTLTSARPDHALAEELKARYPDTWAEREADGSGNGTSSEETQGIQTLTVYIGNRHNAVPLPIDQPRENQHEWSFFVKPSRTDIIEEVHIHLHPSFDNSHIIRQRPPYQVEAQGWGVFTITASVILKAGYSWVSDDAQNTPDGAPKGMLPLEWTLTFDAFGSKGAMGRCRLKVKNDRLWDTADNEGARDRRELRRMVSQYERDGRWEP